MNRSEVMKDMTPEEKVLWGAATASDYVKFDGEVDIQFVNGKISTATGIGGKPSYEFDVILTTDDNEKEAKILGTQSKGLLEQLMVFYPLSEKRFAINRTGEGFQTLYTVKEI